ncbi:hypothetical protein IAU60_001624 [Kwoniella sp. DSM 27419]
MPTRSGQPFSIGTPAGPNQRCTRSHSRITSKATAKSSSRPKENDKNNAEGKRKRKGGAPKNPQFASTPYLPNEIMYHVFAHFDSCADRGTLAAACLTSKRFHNLAAHILWRHVVLSPRDEQKGKRRTSSKAQTQSDDIGSFSTRGSHCKNLAKHTTHLTVRYHSSAWCRHPKDESVKLPQLETLHIVLPKSGYSLCDSRAYDNDAESSSGAETSDDETGDDGSVTSSATSSQEKSREDDHCRLVADLSPKTIVFHNAPTNHIHLYNESFSQGLWMEVERLIFLTPACRGAFGECGDLVELPAMPKLKRLDWLFDPTPPRHAKAFKPYNHRDAVHSCAYASLLDTIPVGVKVTWVNIGVCGRYIERSKGWTFQNAASWSEEFIRYDLPTLAEQACSFIGLEEYLARDDWQGCFEGAEVEGWRKAMKKYRHK